MSAFLHLLTGDRSADLARHTARSSKKVVAIGMSLLLVTGIWAAIGFLLGRVVLELSMVASILLAGAMAAIIFVVDRSIILVKATGWHALLVRGALAALGAYLGAIGIDQALFDADIRQVVATLRLERLRSEEQEVANAHMAQEALLREALAGANTAHQQALGIFHAELDGAGPGNGQRGFGAVARQKAKAVDHCMVQVEQAQARLDAFLQAKDQHMREAREQAAAGARDGALLERMVALETFLDRNPVAFRKVFLPLLLFMFLIELIPLYLKLGTGNTAYEEELAAVELLRMQRAQALLRDQQRWIAREEGLSVEARQAEQYLTTIGAQATGVSSMWNLAKPPVRAA